MTQRVPPSGVRPRRALCRAWSPSTRPFAGDDQVVAGGVKADGVEYQRRARHELRTERGERGPETTGSTATGLRKRHKLVSAAKRRSSSAISSGPAPF